MKGKIIRQPLNDKGTTLTELLVVLGIFAIIMSGFFAAYIAQIKYTTKEYKVAESDIEFEVGKSIIERDLVQAGYGFADDYTGVPVAVVPAGLLPVSATDGPDTLTVRGTGVGKGSSATTRWSTIISGTTNYRIWIGGSLDENILVGARIIYIEPTLKTIMISSGAWFQTVATSGQSPVVPISDNPWIIYGLDTVDPGAPLYAVRYYLGGVSPTGCAPNTQSLLRAESNAAADLTTPAGGDPILSCVRDFQVALGLDTDEDGVINCWDNGGGTAAVYDVRTLKRRLKQIRIYALVQTGNRDPDFTYANPDPAAATPQTIRVGDLSLTACLPAGGGVGVNVVLAGQELQYRWKVITLNIKPRNLR